MGELHKPPLVVLGGSGFLGAWVIQEALVAGHAVVNVCRRPLLAPDFGAGRGVMMAFDLSQPQALYALLDLIDTRTIVNCMALSRAADCERDPAQARRLNTEIPGQLGAKCAARGIRLLHVSTDLVFDGRPPRASGYREADAARPLAVYGQSKLAGERELLAANGEALVVRLPLLCGDSGGRGLGASDSLRARLRRGGQARLFTDEFRTPLDVRLAARAVLELIVADQAGVLHVAGPERLSRFELGQLSLPAAGVGGLQACSRKEHTQGPPRPADVSLDGARARAILGLELLSPRQTLASGRDSANTA